MWFILLHSTQITKSSSVYLPQVSSFSPEKSFLSHIFLSIICHWMDLLPVIFGYYKALKRIQTIKGKTSWSHSNIKAHFSLDQLCQGRCTHFTLRALLPLTLNTENSHGWYSSFGQHQFVSLHFARMNIFTEAVKRNVYCLQAPSSDMFSNT